MADVLMGREILIGEDESLHRGACYPILKQANSARQARFVQAGEKPSEENRRAASLGWRDCGEDATSIGIGFV